MLLLTALVFAFLAFQGAIAFWPYPRNVNLPPLCATLIEARDGTLLAAFVAPDGQWRLPLTKQQISPHLLAAIVAVEDARFYDHSGVDWRAVAAACWQDLHHSEVRRGASTLTMQLQRLRDPRPRSLFNKLEQAVRARQLEKRAGKEQILVEYLNRAPFGGNLTGVGAASWRYFGRPCRDLSLAQAALLAGLPQSPNRLRPDRHPAAARARRDHVLNCMLALGLIDASQRDAAVAEPIDARWRDLPQHAADTGVLPTLERLRAAHAGPTIRTTLDPRVQRLAHTMTAEHLCALAPSHVTAAAVVVLDTTTSQCLASASLTATALQSTGAPPKFAGTPPSSLPSTPPGEIDFTTRPRSTGSTLKPFIYAAAFDTGICSPAATLLDSPAAWPGYAPANYDRAFRGPLPAADALADSRNIPALVLLNQIGVERAVGVMESFGLHTLGRVRHSYGLPLAIGGADATPFELAGAYATLARGGTWRRATLLAIEPVEPLCVMRPDPCRQVLAALSRPDRTAAICAEAARLRPAWKTGTSSGHRDAWCAAVTPRRAVVVWLGNPDAGDASTALVGVDAAAPLALRLLAAIDPGGPSWPQDSEEILVAARASAPILPPEPPLTIITPARDQQVVLNSDIPPDRQQLLLEATAIVWWFIDGHPLVHDRRAWWPPARGPHRIRAVDDAGRSTAIELNVEER